MLLLLPPPLSSRPSSPPPPAHGPAASRRRLRATVRIISECVTLKLGAAERPAQPPRDDAGHDADGDAACAAHRIRISSGQAFGSPRVIVSSSPPARDVDFGAVEARACPGAERSRRRLDRPAVDHLASAVAQLRLDRRDLLLLAVGLITRPVTVSSSLPLASLLPVHVRGDQLQRAVVPARRSQARAFHSGGARNQNAAASAATIRTSTARQNRAAAARLDLVAPRGTG